MLEYINMSSMFYPACITASSAILNAVSSSNNPIFLAFTAGTAGALASAGADFLCLNERDIDTAFDSAGNQIDGFLTDGKRRLFPQVQPPCRFMNMPKVYKPSEFPPIKNVNIYFDPEKMKKMRFELSERLGLLGITPLEETRVDMKEKLPEINAIGAIMLLIFGSIAINYSIRTIESIQSFWNDLFSRDETEEVEEAKREAYAKGLVHGYLKGLSETDAPA